MSQIIKKNVVVMSKQGLHARPAALFVQLANKFDSIITITKDEQEVNGKSIMGILMLAAEQGSQILIVAEGDDAGDAISALEELVSKESAPFRVVVSAASNVESLALVTIHGEETALKASGTEIDIRGTVLPPTADGWCYYYVRVVQDDGEVAWSSPIWLDAPDTA